jgi:anti-sigma regulatory factor (Ser/Thr protein kinase)
MELKRSLRSEVAAISPFVDKLMRLVRKCGCVPERDSDVEMALREALANAVIHGNQENTRKHVCVRFCCKRDEVSIAVKEMRGGDLMLTRLRILRPPKTENPFMAVVST